MSMSDGPKQPEPGVGVGGTIANITNLMANRSGPLPLSGGFTTQGGALHVFVSGSGTRRANVLPGVIGMDIRLDDEEIGTCQVFVDEQGKRGTFVPVFIIVSGISPGTHDLVLHPFSRTETDENDVFNATIIEYETTKDAL